MFKFGIMGAGGIASKFCQAVKLTEGAVVTAVASKNTDRAMRFAAQNNIFRSYGNYEEMLSKENLDAVYIATTNNFHYENINLCIDYGVPVLCEKSMFLSMKEAQRTFARAEEKRVFTMEAMWSRFLPCIQKAKEWIESGRIGTIQTAVYTGGIHAPREHRIFDANLGGGALYDLMVYPIEILTFLINQPLRDIRADIVYGESGVDEADYILLKFRTCRAAVQVTAHARIPSPCGIYGTEGYIQMEQTHRASEVKLYDEQFRLMEHFTSPVENGFEYEIAEVIRCVQRGSLESDRMPHKDTLACVEIFERILDHGQI